MEVQMSSAAMNFQPVQGSSKVDFPIRGHSVDCKKVEKAPEIAFPKRMPQLDRNRMRKGFGANTGLKRIRGQTVEVELAGPGAAKPSFCD